jgi:hypothetical protein
MYKVYIQKLSPCPAGRTERNIHRYVQEKRDCAYVEDDMRHKTGVECSWVKSTSLNFVRESPVRPFKFRLWVLDISAPFNRFVQKLRHRLLLAEEESFSQMFLQSAPRCYHYPPDVQNPRSRYRESEWGFRVDWEDAMDGRTIS